MEEPEQPSLSGELVPLERAPLLPELPRVGFTDVYAALLADARKPTTRRAREQDCTDLARFLFSAGEPTPLGAVAVFLAGGSGQANAIATAWATSMRERKLSPATMNRRISTLRRLVKLARRFNLVDWSLEVDSQRVEAYRDTRGPGRSGWLQVLALARRRAERGTEKGRRDLAIVLLLHDHGLRRSEVVGLDVADWDPDGARLWILGKGKQDKTAISVNAQGCAALERWLEVRGIEPGPLFVRLDRARPKDQLERMDGDGVLWVTSELGKAAGLKTRVKPHGLRHEAITRLLELTHGNIADAQRFARHSDPKTTMIYNDKRKDVAGEMARLLGDDA